uniref:ATP-dependent Clp protease proteolytic subunit n=1 Tax=Astragalus obscurus TaxID=90199 RepID=A0A8K1JFG3_9FABA|nr:clp protease proteolytic subunit [Astragalus obscurus]UCS40836.1 clp protease proteolytic subunit [Astragalus obscurus]
MPVGIPRVPFLIPDDDDSSWVDLYNRLYQQRLLFLGRKIDSELSNQLVGIMVYLSMKDKTKDLYMFINSPGGGLVSGMAVYDGMQFIDAEVQTVCVGIAVSMASFILQGGAMNKRLAFPHSRVMMHQPACSLDEGNTSDCLLDSDEVIIMRNSIVESYAKRTGQPMWMIAEDLDRDFFMSAEEARAYGIVDMVAEED